MSLAARAVPASAQQAPPPSSGLRASRATGPIVIDGILTEADWSRAEVADHFTQRDPDEGKPATERTEIRILYDDEAIYVAARLFDGQPDRIVRRLSNRDDPPDADHISFFFDPRHDRLTGAMFRVSAAGVQADNVISNDTNEDGSWDAVWTSAVTVDAQGWCAELRIPFSQLRFNAAEQQTWGINVARYIQRKNETAWLELVPKNENGLASRMVPLTGLDGIHPARRLELAPYTAMRQEFVQPSRAGDPFNDGSRTFGAVGLDLKAGVTSGLTLDATINPDFGQAEVDPAVVNLSAFETFFDEKRRFFIEGSEIFGNFGTGGSNNFFGFNTSDPNLFYSRRIGRAPQAPAGGDFADVPRATTILGAAKLTGKTANGWSIGLLDAVTSREHARILTGSVRSRTEVEPLTNYLVGRLKHDFTWGGAGLMATSVVRNLDTPLLKDLLTRRATVFGGDAFYFFDRKHDWVVTGKMSGSHISGSEAALTGIQLEPQRYFQRPDAPEVSFDPHRTSLSGYAGAGEPQSQRGRLARERGAVGREPRLRVERSRISLQRRSRRRARGAHVEPHENDPGDAQYGRLGGPRVRLEFQQGDAQQPVVRVRQCDVPELLEHERLWQLQLPDVRRFPDARRSDCREPGSERRQRRHEHRFQKVALAGLQRQPLLDKGGGRSTNANSHAQSQAVVCVDDFDRAGAVSLSWAGPIRHDAGRPGRGGHVRPALRVCGDRPDAGGPPHARELHPHAARVAARLHAAAPGHWRVQRVQGTGGAAHI